MNRLELKAWRVARRLTQPALAERLGVSVMTLWRWESGDHTVPPYLHLALERLEQLHHWEAGEDVKYSRRAVA
jgi:transcriptional regulator with XRE-family HTH domain